MRVETTNEQYYISSNKLESKVQNKNTNAYFQNELILQVIKDTSEGNNVQNQLINLSSNLAPLNIQAKSAQSQISNGYLDIKI